ncbi:MAG: VWA domain-containing protein [Candidatus Pacearchaeota archaeon]
MKFNLINGKKGYYFSLDALIALIIIIIVILSVTPPTNQKITQKYVQQDLLNSLSSLEIGKIDNDYVNQLISEGKIKDLNQSVLEQIGEFYALSKPEATLMTQEILNEINLNDNIAIYFSNVLIAENSSKEISEAEDVWTSRQIISGIKQGESVKGYSSRAFLSSSSKVKYIYFGGYVGDGNITLESDGKIESIYVEAIFSEDFYLYINNQFVGEHDIQSNEIYKFVILGNLSQVNNEKNKLTFVGKNGNLFIGGGFVKIIYNEEELTTLESKKNLPGIDGLINIYDSFYILGNLTSMEIFLHYNSSQNIFMTIGNITIYNGNSGGRDFEIIIPNSNLTQMFDYSKLSRKTIPLRLGLENVSYQITQNIGADIFSVTDLSSSMNSNIPSLGIKMIDLARNANRRLIEIVLELDLNRVGLVGYNSGVNPNNYHPLSNNIISLNNTINSWTTKAGNCVCCGVINATGSFVAQSMQSRKKFMIVMTDGNMQGTCYPGSNSATADAIRAACEAYNNHNITIHTVGFGDNADETTLQSMASCGNGNYYHSNIEELISVYSEIAEDILNSLYFEQTIISENIKSTLYPDSYIKLNYSDSTPYGLIISAETEEFGNTISEGELFIPEDVTPYEIIAISYSGSKWTDKVQIYNYNLSIWEEIFDLSKFNLPYIFLGDPFAVNIPSEKILSGENKIRISTALNPNNSTGGSEHNKIIYRVVKKMLSFSPIVASAEGCAWNIEFENGENSTILVPSNYSGQNECSYTSHSIAYNNNDAINLAIYRLLTNLDLNSNNKIETKFTENDISLTTSEIQGIPFTWDTEVQVRVWR